MTTATDKAKARAKDKAIAMATPAINPNSILQSFNSKPILVLAAIITMMWLIAYLK